MCYTIYVIKERKGYKNTNQFIERGDNMKIDEMKKEIEEIEERISVFYRTDRKGIDEEHSYQWYMENVRPLSERRDELKDLIRREERMNVKVGDGVTLCYYSDRHAYTIIKRTAKSITIQQDKATRIDNNGMSEDQDYTYERNYNGSIKVARWSEKKGCFMVGGCLRVVNGRGEYYDYSF